MPEREKGGVLRSLTGTLFYIITSLPFMTITLTPVGLFELGQPLFDAPRDLGRGEKSPTKKWKSVVVPDGATARFLDVFEVSPDGITGGRRVATIRVSDWPDRPKKNQEPHGEVVDIARKEVLVRVSPKRKKERILNDGKGSYVLVEFS